MFVQIGDQAFDPKGATVQFLFNGQGAKYVSLTSAGGAVLLFSDKDYDPFVDWWTNCANVSRFPRRQPVK